MIEDLKDYYKNHFFAKRLKDCLEYPFNQFTDGFKHERMRFINDALDKGFYKKSIAEFLDISTARLNQIINDKKYNKIVNNNDNLQIRDMSYISNYIQITSR